MVDVIKSHLCSTMEPRDVATLNEDYLWNDYR